MWRIASSVIGDRQDTRTTKGLDMTDTANMTRALCGEHGEGLSVAPGDTGSLLACGRYVARRAAGMDVDAAAEDGCLLYVDDLDVDPGLVVIRSGEDIYVAEDITED